MSTAISQLSAVPPVRAETAGVEQRIVLPGLTWRQYVTMTDALPDRPDIRTAFDGRNLELMTTSSQHERVKRILNRLIESICRELEIDMQGGGMTTFRDAAIEKGLEADESYWIAHVEDVIGIDRWQAGVHPPPDLVVEIDIASMSLGRQPIYADLGVPEIWRFHGEGLTALSLTENGDDVTIQQSLSFPFLTVAELEPYIAATSTQSESSVDRQFVDWLRQQNFTV